MAIAARPTTYRGIEMRSRLEARFASFLDGQDFTWEYEPRAFAGPAGQYLPDFVVDMVHGWRLYVDVKGQIGGLPEAAYALLWRMRVIRESDPRSVLAIIPEELTSAPGRVFLVNTPQTPPGRFWSGFFGICASCHRTSLGTRNGLACHRCLAQGDPVARLDPFYRPEAA